MKNPVRSLLTAAVVMSGILTSAMVAQSASADGTMLGAEALEGTTIKINNGFRDSKTGWGVLFADYTAAGDLGEYDLAYERKNLPQPLDTSRGALYLSGHNRSDDLAMFVTKELNIAHGVKSNTTYKVDFRFQIATNAISGGFGSGGDPGTSVHVKAGAVTTKPAVTLQTGNDSHGVYRANFDHGDQIEDGKDAVNVGNLAKPSGSEDDSYELKGFNNLDKPFYVKSNAQGQIWLLIGTDSGYEGLTQIYIPWISATLTQAHLPAL